MNNRATLQSVPDPFEDWRTQRHPNESVIRARQELNELLVAIDALEQEILLGDRERLFPPHILMCLLVGIGMPRQSLQEILKRFRAFYEDQLVLVRKEALAILCRKRLISEPSLRELRTVFAAVVQRADLPSIHWNNLAPDVPPSDNEEGTLALEAA